MKASRGCRPCNKYQIVIACWAHTVPVILVDSFWLVSKCVLQTAGMKVPGNEFRSSRTRSVSFSSPEVRDEAATPSPRRSHASESGSPTIEQVSRCMHVGTRFLFVYYGCE